MNSARYLTLTILVITISCFTSFSQISTIEEIKLPEALRAKYPFVKETFYSVKALDITGVEGYFVFTFDKSQMQDFMDTLIYNKLKEKLVQYNFFRKVCKPEPLFYICDRKYSDLTRFSLTQKPISNIIFANYALEKINRYSLDAKYVKYSHASKLFEGCIKSKNSYDRRLFDSKIKTLTEFQYDEQNFVLRMKSEASASMNILFDDCSNVMLSVTPYSSLRTEVIKLAPQTMEISLSELSTEATEILRMYLNNVKRIRLTEDNTTYYVYCIKSKT